ncbi:CHAT domain-containing protein [Scytonema sp. UIC 10036]|uniref:CHAT domain-containing protein n=1 Tax=Scytonema sp. UIC 10036 TaxID=2304196 RepID=UPI001FAAFF96|nr:CHAT domain-containing protein [Scytonema sp. UIC 10036]
MGEKENLVEARELVNLTDSAMNSSDSNTVEQLDRRLIELKLNSENIENRNRKSKNDTSQNLTQVINAIENLKITEFNNYFHKNFLSLKFDKTRIDLVDGSQATALVYSVILKDRTAIVLNLPHKKKKWTWIDINYQNLRKEINEFQIGLERRSDIIYDPKQAQKLYDWIIRPFANDLESFHIKTLVFIQDEILRGVPMAALHDGKKFLIQKYAIATTPGLSLTNTQKVNRKNLRALAVGLTKDATVDGRIYKALTNIQHEIYQVVVQIPGSKLLLDEDFTPLRLHAELRKKSYPIIHIATHGEFGIVPEETFLVTGNNQKLTIIDLGTLIQDVSHGANLVELLALTACETAIGDKNAIFGLAGVAVKAGVKSALASLWSVNDAATETLVTKFYKEWSQAGISKAEALQKAQQAMIATGKVYAHPYYWAPFILIGNWL